jgi:hypothetical protein
MGESREAATALLRVHPAKTRDRLRRPAHRSRLRASGARTLIFPARAVILNYKRHRVGASHAGRSDAAFRFDRAV